MKIILIFWKVVLFFGFIGIKGRLARAEWCESKFKKFLLPLVSELEIQKTEEMISFLKQIFPFSVLLWYSCHRYLLREKRNAGEEELKELLALIKRDRKEVKESLIEYGLRNILEEFKKTGELKD